MEEHIHQSNLIEGIDDPKQDFQSLLAWNYLETQTHLTHNVIKRVHYMITQFQPDLDHKHKGEYRSIEVQVGKKLCPPSFIVPHLMENWILDYWKKGSQEAHIQFESIHPFADGNGRTGRMLMWWQQKQRNLEPQIILFDKRKEYYRWFEPKKDMKGFNRESGLYDNMWG